MKPTNPAGPFPPGPFDLILCDPPWRYEDSRSKASVGAARSAYADMSLADIKALPVMSIAAPNAALALWATGPKLLDAVATMAAWGFKYLTVLFVWSKVYRDGSIYSGLGHYTKSGAEFVLLGRRGKPLPRASRSVRQVLQATVAGHSAKPGDEVRSRLEALFGPDVRRIELFARETRPNWNAWGDQVPAVTE